MPEQPTYAHDLYRDHDAATRHSAQTVLALTLDMLPPVHSVVEFGCGVGTWLAAAKSLGVEHVLGYEGDGPDDGHLLVEADEFRRIDFATATPLSSARHDLALSLDVAQHLPHAAVAPFIAALCGATDFVIFSAAAPGRGDTGPINKTWPAYWTDLFAEHDFAALDPFHEQNGYDGGIKSTYCKNTLLLVKRARLTEVQTQSADTDRHSQCVQPAILPRATGHPSRGPEAADTTLVVTSCGRLDLLTRTIDSFDECNSYPMASRILIEDSADPTVFEAVQRQFADRFDSIITNDPKRGQIASIDHAYAQVTTPYIFHCEDDWLFFRSGFVEESRAVLDFDDEIITVWLRELWDTKRRRIKRDIHRASDGTMYRYISRTDEQGWHGFTFNPGLRRLSDYRRIAPFIDIGHEYEINVRYWHMGYRAAILEQGAVEHLGHRRSERKKELGQTRSPWWPWRRLLGKR